MAANAAKGFKARRGRSEKKFSKPLDKLSNLCYNNYRNQGKRYDEMTTAHYNDLKDRAITNREICKTLRETEYCMNHPVAAFKTGKKYNGKKVSFFKMVSLILWYPFEGKALRKNEKMYRNALNDYIQLSNIVKGV